MCGAWIASDVLFVCSSQQVHKAFYDDHDGVTVEEQMAGNGRDVKRILGEVCVWGC